MYKKLITAIVVLVAISSMGCAQRSANIVPNNVSAFQYASSSCTQLQAEYSTVTTQLNAMMKKQDSMATTDAVAMTVGLLVFWPALIVNAATPDHKAEIAELKGRQSALNQAMMMECRNDNRNYASGN